MKIRTFFAGALTVLLVSSVALGAKKPNFEIKPADRTMGNPKAKVVLIEYASLTCPHCAAFNAEVMPQIKKNYIDTKKVFYVFRLFPRGPEDGMAEKMARCAPPAKYFTIVDHLFRDQEKWDPEYRIKDSRTPLIKLGVSEGMKADQIAKCMDSTTDDARINAVAAEADQRYALTGTPTFVINGEALESGGLPYADLAKKLDQAAH